MERHSFAFRSKRGKLADILTAFGDGWQEIQENLAKNEIKNFSLWNCDLFFFGYYESKRARSVTGEILMPAISTIRECCDWTSDFENDMRLMYEDFGIVRDDKSMIRHRVFMTHLLDPSFTTEYKRRHDGLVNARTEIDKGPDSNFSIWNAGEYIFGYDEIDTSMEHEMTENEREENKKWENKMLDIMEWITDDVDWITDLHHSHIKRIAYKE